VVTEPELIEERRVPLTRERLLRAAVDLADRGGIEALSMRKLGQELGVEAMALYRHVRDKTDLLNGVVDLVIGEIERPPAGADWKATMRAQAMAARATMVRHPWARRALEDSGTSGPSALVYIESLLATLRDGGFSLDLAHHTLHVLGSRVFGFSQDIFEEGDEDASAEPNPIVAGVMADRFPRITEMAQAASHEGVLGRCDDDVEFAFGLDLILDGLERRRSAAGEGPA
jgi:AcrR family transcriptional regulator